MAKKNIVHDCEHGEYFLVGFSVCFLFMSGIWTGWYLTAHDFPENYSDMQIRICRPLATTTDVSTLPIVCRSYFDLE